MRELIPVFVLLVFVFFAAWLLRTLLENRRWSRVLAIHADAHSRLLQRLESSQELMSYIQSEPGRRFLEAAPLAAGLAPAGRVGIGGRVLFSLQAGIVVALVGATLLGLRNSIENGHDPLLVIGSAGLALGAGFILSAIASVVMARHLGLMPLQETSESR